MLIESFSGIRGIYGKELNADVAMRYSFCYSEFLKKRNKTPVIVVGTDTRASREELKNAVIEGLNTDVIDIGIAATPAVEFAVRHFKADGGVIITASHNEPEWNGFKFLDSDGAVLRPKDAKEVISKFDSIRKIDKTDFFMDYLADGKVKVKKIIKQNVEKEYFEFLIGIIGKTNIEKIKKSKLKVIIDPNGGAAYIAKKFLEKVGVEVIGVNMEAGIFKRVIEPNESSLSYLKKRIADKKADLAAGFDCDGDRIGIIARSGFLSGHYALALIVDEILNKRSDSPIVINDATSGVVKEVAKKHNVEFEEVEVGEINVVDTMEILGSAVGGEGSSSGVIIPPSKCRDGILTLLMILSIIAKKQKPLEKIIEEYPKYCTLTDKAKFNPKEHDKIKIKIKEHYLKKGHKIQETGGISGGLKIVIDETSFLWFRASKTEGDVFRIMADSKDELKARSLLKEGRGFFK